MFISSNIVFDTCSIGISGVWTPLIHYIWIKYLSKFNTDLTLFSITYVIYDIGSFKGILLQNMLSTINLYKISIPQKMYKDHILFNDSLNSRLF